MYKEHKDYAKRIASARTAIQGILPLDLYPAHKTELLSVCIWKITEAHDKWYIRYWTEAAMETAAEATTKKQMQKNLRHEHVNTRKELIDRLLNKENIDSVIKDAVACIVTKDEHTELTKSSASGWQRYKETGIKVFDYKNLQWKKK